MPTREWVPTAVWDGTAFRPLPRGLLGVSATSACPRGGDPGLPPSMMNGRRFHPPPLPCFGWFSSPAAVALGDQPSALVACVCSRAPVHQAGKREGEGVEGGRDARQGGLAWAGGAGPL